MSESPKRVKLSSSHNPQLRVHLLHMSVQTSLQKIRKAWIERISRELASGEGVRAGFAEQLERFYELLEQTIATGDTAWLDSILYDWGHAPT